MKTFLLCAMLTVPVSAMGRLPTDPATYKDIQDAEAMTSVTNNREIAHYAQTQADLSATNDRIDQLTEPKILIEGAVRLYDGKRIALEAFNSFDAAHGHEFAYGSRITLKLGTSYEERQLKVQAKEIERLRQLIETRTTH